jgi:hypothetical protein
MNTKKYVYTFIALATLTTLVGAVPALADNTTSNNQPNNGVYNNGVRNNTEGMMNRSNNGMMKFGVFGTVSAISGNVITITSKQRSNPTATTAIVSTTYTVDATNAKITKNNVAGTMASIVVGDTVVVQGTVTGTNVVATAIRDGVLRNGLGKMLDKNAQDPFLSIVGNGQPVVLGTVSVISGSTVTITNKSNITYTIDTTNAKITQGSNAISISGIVVGDNLVVQGTVNGSTVVASTVIDQKAQPVNTNTGATTTRRQGFFGGIGSFFAHLFGY